MNEGSVDFQKVPIRPVDCLTQATNLLGDQYWLFVGICAVGMLIGSAVPMAILAGPMMCGVYLCYFKRMQGERVTFDLLFKGFDYFVESLIATLILVGAMMIILVPIYLVFFVLFIGFGAFTGQAPDGEFALGFFGLLGLVYFLILVLSILVGTFFIFVYPLIVDRGLKAVPALKTSFKAALANFGGVLGLVLLTTLMGFLAACCCYLPVFLVLPITFGATALAYRKVFPET